MAAAIVLLLTNQFVLRRDDKAPATAEIPAKSIAVLPFTDLSPAHDQEYFSDGMAEELLNALAKLKDLKVAGRTSSFSFKGKNEDLRTIGKALGVANVLEGSVRKQGDKVRITAQLIQVVGRVSPVVATLTTAICTTCSRCRNASRARSPTSSRSC